MHVTTAQAAALEGDTAPPDLAAVVNLHFVALVERGGRCTCTFHPIAPVRAMPPASEHKHAAVQKTGTCMQAAGIHG